MKHLLHTILAITAFALPSQALEQRAFHDAGKTKTFQATLKAYDAKSKSVTVVNEAGKTVKFPLNVISEDCQKYVLSKQDLLNIAKNVKLKFTEIKDAKNADTRPTGYAIEVNNGGKNSIKDITLNYTLYYSEGDLVNGGTVDKIQEGTLSTGKMYDSDTLTVKTAMVSLVRSNKPASGGG